MAGVLGKLKQLDAYPKVNEDFFTKTFSGGIVTIVSSVIMVLLFLSELCEWKWHGHFRVFGILHAPSASQPFICDQRACTSYQLTFREGKRL